MRMPSLIAATLLLGSATLAAQTPAAKFVDSARTEIDAAALAGDDARLANAVVFLDRALAAFPNDAYLLHYRGYAAYRRAAWLFKAGNVQAALPFVDRAEPDLIQSAKTLAWPETYSVLAALTGIRIAVDPISSKRSLGPLSSSYAQQALQMGPANPRVLYFAAQAAYRTPPDYGGGVEPARTLLAQALDAFKTDKPGPLMPAWGREEAIAFDKEIGH